MTSYEIIWDYAEDHFGIITSAQAKELGVGAQNIVAMEQSGQLTRLGHGVYRTKHHSIGENDQFAACVACAGANAFLRSASVLALLKLCPTNPAAIYLGSTSRVRRHFPDEIKFKDQQRTEVVEYEGIRCQPLVLALKTALHEGAVERDQIVEAAEKALDKGLITNEEFAQFKV